MSAIVSRAYRVRGLTAVPTSEPLAERYTRRRTGKLERRQPLPPGRYWIDVFAPKIEKWEFWLETTPGVKIENAQSFEATEDFPARRWTLFETTMPVAFDFKDFGFPDVATPDVKNSEDTSTRPPPERFELPSFQIGVTLGTVIVALALAFVILRTLR